MSRPFVYLLLLWFGFINSAISAPEGRALHRAEAGKRIALVIGNDTYQNSTVLKNARTNAHAIAQMLKSVGFDVTLHIDLTGKQMKETLRGFNARVEGGDEVVFYFSGHGVQIGHGHLSGMETADLEQGWQNRMQTASAEAGKVIKDCADCPEMVVVPAGRFMMGGNDCFVVDTPDKPVTVPSFLLGKTEVTQGQWRAVMGTNPSHFKACGDDCPVEQVSWDDAQEFIKKLNGKTGQLYRLPSEAEWEYAARAGSTTRYPWGDAIGSNRANCDGCGSEWDNKTTAPVGQFAANAFGLHDMNGNVWEWTQDCMDFGNLGAPPADSGSGWTLASVNCKNSGAKNPVLRGGAWNNEPAEVCSAMRTVDSSANQMRLNP